MQFESNGSIPSQEMMPPNPFKLTYHISQDYKLLKLTENTKNLGDFYKYRICPLASKPEGCIWEKSFDGIIQIVEGPLGEVEFYIESCKFTSGTSYQCSPGTIKIMAITETPDTVAQGLLIDRGQSDQKLIDLCFKVTDYVSLNYQSLNIPPEDAALYSPKECYFYLRSGVFDHFITELLNEKTITPEHSYLALSMLHHIRNAIDSLPKEGLQLTETLDDLQEQYNQAKRELEALKQNQPKLEQQRVNLQEHLEKIREQIQFQKREIETKWWHAERLTPKNIAKEIGVFEQVQQDAKRLEGDLLQNQEELAKARTELRSRQEAVSKQRSYKSDSMLQIKETEDQISLNKKKQSPIVSAFDRRDIRNYIAVKKGFVNNFDRFKEALLDAEEKLIDIKVNYYSIIESTRTAGQLPNYLKFSEHFLRENFKFTPPIEVATEVIDDIEAFFHLARNTFSDADVSQMNINEVYEKLKKTYPATLTQDLSRPDFIDGFQRNVNKNIQNNLDHAYNILSKTGWKDRTLGDVLSLGEPQTRYAANTGLIDNSSRYGQRLVGFLPPSQEINDWKMAQKKAMDAQERMYESKRVVEGLEDSFARSSSKRTLERVQKIKDHFYYEARDHELRRRKMLLEKELQIAGKKKSDAKQLHKKQLEVVKELEATNISLQTTMAKKQKKLRKWGELKKKLLESLDQFKSNNIVNDLVVAIQEDRLEDARRIFDNKVNSRLLDNANKTEQSLQRELNQVEQEIAQKKASIGEKLTAMEKYQADLEKYQAESKKIQVETKNGPNNTSETNQSNAKPKKSYLSTSTVDQAILQNRPILQEANNGLNQRASANLEEIKVSESFQAIQRLDVKTETVLKESQVEFKETPAMDPKSGKMVYVADHVVYPFKEASTVSLNTQINKNRKLPVTVTTLEWQEVSVSRMAPISAVSPSDVDTIPPIKQRRNLRTQTPGPMIEEMMQHTTPAARSTTTGKAATGIYQADSWVDAVKRGALFTGVGGILVTGMLGPLAAFSVALYQGMEEGSKAALTEDFLDQDLELELIQMMDEYLELRKDFF